ncbi:hypothetical protein MPER_09834, partial [Moniliophthora perniciosa FA553]
GMRLAKNVHGGGEVGVSHDLFVKKCNKAE